MAAARRVAFSSKTPASEASVVAQQTMKKEVASALHADAFSRDRKALSCESQRAWSRDRFKAQISSSTFIVAYFRDLDCDDLAWTFVLDATQPARVFAQLELHTGRHNLTFFIEVTHPV